MSSNNGSPTSLASPLVPQSKPQRNTSRVRSHIESGPQVVLDVLHRRWRVIMLGTLSVLLAVSMLTLVWPRRYDSSALILVEQRLAGNDSSALAVLERLGQASRLETELEILKSRPVIEEVVDELDLHVLIETPEGQGRAGNRLDLFSSFEADRLAAPGSYELQIDETGTYRVFNMSSKSEVARGASVRDIQFAGLQLALRDSTARSIRIVVEPFARAVEEAQERIGVSRPQRDAALIDVTGSGRDPEAAHALCDATLRNYMQLRTKLQRTEATATAEFLRDQSTRVGAQLREAEQRLESFSRKNHIVALKERANEEVRQHTRLRDQRDQLEAERSALAKVLERNEAEDGGSQRYRDLASFPTFLGNEAITELLRSLVELENRRSDLARTRSTRNRDVAALDQRISDLEGQLRGIVISYEASLADQILSLDETLASSEENLASIPTRQVETARLERETTLLGDLHRLLETRLREAEVAQAVNLPGVRIVGEASMPFEPASPSLPRNVAIGLALGLLYGLVLAVYREFRDTSIRERHDVERETGLPVLSVIPHLRGTGALIPVSTVREVTVGTGGITPVAGDRFGEVAFEAFRSIGAAIQFAGRTLDLDRVRSVAVASTARNEGKTFTACNLALTRARSQSRTLLVDADLRGNGVARFFNLPDGSPGLCEVLAGTAELEQVAQKLWTGESPFWVLPVGSVTSESASLLESNWFQTFLQQASDDFDLVIIDTPPLNVMTDGATIASAVNAVFLVVRSGVTDREDLEITIERLRQANARVVGAVLNDVALPKHHATRYTYYSATAEQT